ncbi:MAG: hypothetical protein Q7U53_03235 [Anaerolineaceae bacterium]|nr:hypothetical protein [Anaerolineaceae bacterium]
MLEKKSNLKTYFTIMFALFVIILGLFGVHWQVGQAQTLPTVPTIPIVFSLSPDTICVGSTNVEATIRGEDFIDVNYTWVKWLDADNFYSYIIPDFVSVDKTELRFTIDADKLDEVYTARIWVVNHPEEPIPNELAGPFIIEIIGCEFIYLPLIMK